MKGNFIAKFVLITFSLGNFIGLNKSVSIFLTSFHMIFTENM